MTAVSNETALWWIVIAIGVVVAACVVILLSLLAAFVGDIAGPRGWRVRSHEHGGDRRRHPDNHDRLLL